MSPRRIKTRDVPRERYSTYLKKARGFLRAAEASLAVGDWDAAALNAVHCGISSADALLVFKAGVRSGSDSHSDAAALLDRHFAGDEAGPKAGTLSKILSYKNLAAYEDREVSDAEAREAAKLARRFFDAAEAKLKAMGG